MIEFIKKNKKIIISSSIFLGINNNIFCGSCCSKISGKNNKKTENDTNNQTNKSNNDPQNNPDHNKDNPQNPPQHDNKNELDQLYSKFCTLYEYVSKNYNKITTGAKHDLPSMKSLVDGNKNKKDILKAQISLL